MPPGQESGFRMSGNGSMPPKVRRWESVSLGQCLGCTAVPTPEKGRDIKRARRSGCPSRGASPFGVEDLVGNVWQWTDELRDEHTRADILRGGSYYQPQGSVWYFPQAYRLTSTANIC